MWILVVQRGIVRIVNMLSMSLDCCESMNNIIGLWISCRIRGISIGIMTRFPESSCEHLQAILYIDVSCMIVKRERLVKPRIPQIFGNITFDEIVVIIDAKYHPLALHRITYTNPSNRSVLLLSEVTHFRASTTPSDMFSGSERLTFRTASNQGAVADSVSSNLPENVCPQ